MTDEEVKDLHEDLCNCSQELSAIAGALGCLQKQVGELMTDPGEVSFLMYGFNGMCEDLQNIVGLLETWADDLTEK